MEYIKEEDRFLIRVDKDENLFQSLEKFASQEELLLGQLTGIGALKNVELGFYHLQDQSYDRRKFQSEYELLSMDGNLSMLDGKPFFHIHAVLGDKDFTCFGGHLFDAIVAVTCEMHFFPLSQRVERRFNNDVGLNLMHFCGITNE